MNIVEVNDRVVYTSKSAVHENFCVAVTGELTKEQKTALHAVVASAVNLFVDKKD